MTLKVNSAVRNLFVSNIAKM